MEFIFSVLRNLEDKALHSTTFLLLFKYRLIKKIKSSTYFSNCIWSLDDRMPTYLTFLNTTNEMMQREFEDCLKFASALDYKL